MLAAVVTTWVRIDAGDQVSRTISVDDTIGPSKTPASSTPIAATVRDGLRATRAIDRPRQVIPSSARRSGPVRGVRAAVATLPTRAPTEKALNSTPEAAASEPSRSARAGKTTGKAPMPPKFSVVATVTARSGGVVAR